MSGNNQTTVTQSIRLNDKTHGLIKARAARNNRSFNAEAALLLESALNQQTACRECKTQSKEPGYFGKLIAALLNRRLALAV
jgi:hypothetical protein